MRLFHLLKRITEKFSVKIFAVFTGFIVIISLTFIIFFIHFVRTYQKDKLISEGKILADLLAYNSRLGVFSENKALLKDPIAGIVQQKGVLEASVFNLQGRLLYAQEGKIDTRQGNRRVQDDRIFKRLKEGESFHFQVKRDKLELWAPIISDKGYLNENSLFFQEEPGKKKESIIGFVKIKLDREGMNRKVQDLLFKSLLIGMLFFFMGTVIIFFSCPWNNEALEKINRWG